MSGTTYIFYEDVPLERFARHCWSCHRRPALGGNLRCVACRLRARRAAAKTPLWRAQNIRPRERLRMRRQHMIERRRVLRG